jgi:hypothetical protein
MPSGLSARKKSAACKEEYEMNKDYQAHKRQVSTVAFQFINKKSFHHLILMRQY